MSWRAGGPSDEPITLELMLRAIEVLQQRPEYQSQPIEKLAEPAYDLLARCNLERELAHNSWETYRDGVARVTGFVRVKKAQVELFERFYADVCLSHPRIGRGPEELAAWKAHNIFPVWIAKKMTVEFSVWDTNRRARLARERNNLKKKLARPSCTKKTI